MSLVEWVLRGAEWNFRRCAARFLRCMIKLTVQIFNRYVILKALNSALHTVRGTGLRTNRLAHNHHGRGLI